MMRKNEYINPFSEKAEMFAGECDDAIIAKNTQKLNELIIKGLDIVEGFDQVSQAKIYYAIGNCFSETAMLSGNPHDDDSYERQLYYIRKSIELTEKDELLRPEFLPYFLSFKPSLYTNYANVLDHIGRKIAAIEQY